MKTIDISVYVAGSVNQTIELDPNCTLTEEEIKSGIVDGSILTSIGHGENNGRVYKMEISPFGMTEIGRVVNQEAGDDLEITFEERDEEV